MDALVTTEWLAGALDAPDVRVLDASYTSTLPGTPVRDPRAGFAEAHVPGARFLDLDTLVDETKPLPSMLPTRERFATRIEALGITPKMRIILYDHGQHHTACRAWWVLRMFGVDSAILDGGFAKWQRENRAIASGWPEPPAASRFEPGPPLAGVRRLEDVLMISNSGSAQIVDARSAARFTGAEPDPRADCAPGHIPGSKNLPYGSVLHPDGTWKSREAIAAAFAAAGIDLARPIVATCGSGITAAVLAFAAHLLGRDVPIYDGSWSEWGADPRTPKALGPA